LVGISSSPNNGSYEYGDGDAIKVIVEEGRHLVKLQPWLKRLIK
jgi:hypothetical protein